MFCVKNLRVCLQEVPAGRHRVVSDENGAGRDLYVCWDEVQTVRDAAASWTQEELHQPCSWTLFCLDLWPPGWRNAHEQVEVWCLSLQMRGDQTSADSLLEPMCVLKHSAITLWPPATAVCLTGLWVLMVLHQLNWSPLPPGVSAGSCRTSVREVQVEVKGSSRPWHFLLSRPLSKWWSSIIIIVIIMIVVVNIMIIIIIIIIVVVVYCKNLLLIQVLLLDCQGWTCPWTVFSFSPGCFLFD